MWENRIIGLVVKLSQQLSSYKVVKICAYIYENVVDNA